MSGIDERNIENTNAAYSCPKCGGVEFHRRQDGFATNATIYIDGEAGYTSCDWGEATLGEWTSRWICDGCEYQLSESENMILQEIFNGEM